MKRFERYVDELSAVIPQLRLGDVRLTDRISLALDGEPSAQLRKYYSVATLRRTGIFFTGSKIARKAIALSGPFAKDCVCFDPTCGAGDLLLAYTEKLPVGRDVQQTLEIWGTRLAGIDIRPEFVRATKVRLLLAAALRVWPQVGYINERTIADAFPLIGAGDALKDSIPAFGKLMVIFNPPYSATSAPSDCEWASGTVSSAAVFLDYILGQLPNRACLTAILPDVLRSGERYQRWREKVQTSGRIKDVAVLGRFDSFADVDVFLLRLQKGLLGPVSKWGWPRSSSRTVEQEFSVSVGTVVPYRHDHLGPWRPFLHAKNLPKWKTVRTISVNLRSVAKFEPPFVVVRRTSSPGDTQRCVPTLITAPVPVAVENHLLVLRPNDGSVTTCKALMRSLQSPKTSNWLNARLRCRHLTVAAMKQLPLWEI